MILTDKQARNVEFMKQLNISFAEESISELDFVLKENEKQGHRIEISIKEGRVSMICSSESLLYRGLFMGLPRFIANGGEQPYIEETSIVEASFSLDASRNAVMKLDTLKTFIAYLAVMGYNTLYLYTEDTYQVDKLPYFGYLRGSYTKEEIREIVSFASDFGMEVIPSIQTLAHLTQYLKWPSLYELRDDRDTLLIGEERVYEAIDQMIATCKELYDTNRIHLGMDEAYQAGLGRYFILNGYRDRTQLMIEHMERVLAIVEKHQLMPMIWSDFIYKLLDKTGSDRYFNPDFILKSEDAKNLPEGLTYIHWDYGSDQVATYEKVIDHHLQFCDIDHYVLASGAHIWGRIAPNHGKTEAIVSAAIEACRNKQVRSVMLTTWGDDGQETEHWHAILGALQFADLIYSNGTWNDNEEIYDRLLGEGSYQMMSHLRYFDEVDSIMKDNLQMTNISKCLLWQDPLVGIYDFQVVEHNRTSDRMIGTYYNDLAKALRSDEEWAPKISIVDDIRERYILLAEILAKKSDLGVRLRQMRMDENHDGLRMIAEECLLLAQKVSQLSDVHERIWYQTYKTFGWEVLEQRYAALAHRLQTVSKRLHYYIEGQDSLEELLEERIPFCDYRVPLEITGFDYRQSSVSGYS